MANQHILLCLDGQWAIKKEGAFLPMSKHSTQQEAIRTAWKNALKQAGSIFIHGFNGRVRKISPYAKVEMKYKKPYIFTRQLASSR